MDLILVMICFAAGLFFIVKGGNLFVDAAAWIAEVSGIPKVIVGATVVSLATTLPEIIVSLIAAFAGKADMAVGNAVGSVTANMGLILSLCALFLPMLIERRAYLAKCLLMLSAVAFLYLFSLDGRLHPAGCALLIAIFALFILENVRSARDRALPVERERPARGEIFRNALGFLLGTAGIVAGAEMLVDSGSVLALFLGVPEGIVGATLIAVGTSLPEFVTAIVSIVKRQGSLSLGNIIGANVIDTTLIIPLCGFLSGRPLAISRQCLSLDLPFCLLIAGLAVLPMLIKGKLMRWQGACMMGVYGVYVTLLVT